jgi:hypothetical protein
MKWVNNLVKISESGEVGECPLCGRSNTDYMYYEHDDGKGYLEVWCNDCGELVHVDCAFVPHDRKRVSANEALKRKKKQNAVSA